uniref:Helitron helicase-like domain-containing protein n=1 Tax=Arundo donax TaxID=35708 RepID=A0A0A8YS21_ARUDO
MKGVCIFVFFHNTMVLLCFINYTKQKSSMEFVFPAYSLHDWRALVLSLSHLRFLTYKFYEFGEKKGKLHLHVMLTVPASLS